MKLKIIIIITAVLIIGGAVFYFGEIGNRIKDRFGLLKEKLPYPITKDIEKVEEESTQAEQTTETENIDNITEDEIVNGTLVEEPEKNESDEIAETEQPKTKMVKDLILSKKEGYVTAGTASCTIKVGDEYWLYTGTSLFVSQNGLNFEERRTALIYDETLDRIGNPAVIRLKDGRYRMFYEGEKFSEQKRDRRLYSAVSFDGMNWGKEGLRYEDTSDSGKSGEMMVSVPEVVRIDDKLYLYYTRGITLAVAVSENEGITWNKIKDIIFEGIEIVMDPDLIQVENGYRLFFTTADNPDLLRATKTWITDAFSLDGIHFEFDGDFKLEADAGKNNAVDADVVYLGDGKYRIYYGQSVEHFGDYGLYSAILEEEK